MIPSTRIFVFGFLIFLFCQHVSCKMRKVKQMNINMTAYNESVLQYSVPIYAYRYVDYEGIVYDLSELYDEIQDYTFNSNDNHYFINIGRFGHTKCRNHSSYAIFFNSSDADENTNCTFLSGIEESDPTSIRIISKYIYIYKLGNYVKTLDIVEITLPPGEICYADNQTETAYYKTVFEITCDRQIAHLAIDNPDAISINSCENRIRLRSVHGKNFRL